jgi:hypothetical protein
MRVPSGVSRARGFDGVEGARLRWRRGRAAPVALGASRAVGDGEGGRGGERGRRRRGADENNGELGEGGMPMQG